MMNLNTVKKNISVTAMACFIGLSGVANADEMNGIDTIVFAGGDVRESANYAYIGLIHHFSGDILSDGFLVRALAGHSNYDYHTLSDQKIDAKADSYEFMLGYQKVMDTFSARGYVGFESEDHELTPDNLLDKNRGTDTGVKVQVELETDFASLDYGSLVASYGTAKERYWARIRGGHEFSGLVVGPEAVRLGDQEYNENRVGLFLTARNILPAMLSVSAGYAQPDTYRGPSGPYFTLEASRSF